MENLKKDLLYQIALSTVPLLGAVNSKQLIAYFGSAEKVFLATKKELLEIPGIGHKIVASIQKKQYLSVAEKELEFAKQYGIDVISFYDEDYPLRLKHCSDAPLLIYKKGQSDLNKPIHISIVGTRRASHYGKQQVDDIIKSIKELGIEAVIISGLAYGIDTQSHTSALKYGLETWGVLAHGLSRIYPQENTNLAKKMLEKGCLITEFISDVFPAPKQFLSRNRIIAGLSDLTIIAESADKGGSLVTADLAFGYNREVMAIPGRVNDSKSKGCNALIKRNVASMCEGIDDIVKLMQWDKIKEKPAFDLFSQLSDEQKKLYMWIKEHPNSNIDVIKKQSGIPSENIPALLLDLEFSNYIVALPGSNYLAH